jgi:hypothetical protein
MAGFDLRQAQVSDPQGHICHVQAEVISKNNNSYVIKRIIKVEQTEKYEGRE